MALKDAVLATAELLEEEAKDQVDTDFQRILRISACMLRNAVLAAEQEPGPPLALSSWPAAQMVSPETQHARAIASAREEFRAKANKEEKDFLRMVEIADGDCAGDMTSIQGDMPVNARMNIAGTVYQLREDGKLHQEPDSLLS